MIGPERPQNVLARDPVRSASPPTEVESLRLAVGARDGVLAMTVARLGGDVEGRPTERVNFLQRIDALREIERRYEAIHPYAQHMSMCAQWGPAWEYPRHLHAEIACTCGLDGLRPSRSAPVRA